MGDEDSAVIISYALYELGDEGERVLTRKSLNFVDDEILKKI